jgi:hypothetical protein
MQSIVSELKVKNRNHRSSAAICADIDHTPIEARHCRNIALAAEIDASDAERFVIFHATAFRGGDFSEIIDNSRGMYLKLGDRLTTATAARNLANLLASAPEVIQARAILDPLYTELDAAQAREQIEAAGAARAYQGVVDATAQARADLEAQIDSHPLVLEATKKALPYHRKGELVTA